MSPLVPRTFFIRIRVQIFKFPCSVAQCRNILFIPPTRANPEEALQPSQPIVFINTESFMNRQNIRQTVHSFTYAHLFLEIYILFLHLFTLGFVRFIGKRVPYFKNSQEKRDPLCLPKGGSAHCTVIFFLLNSSRSSFW
jgi:hypothetical protein